MPDAQPKTITLPPESEFAELLAEASTSGAPLIVETADAAYRLDVRLAEPDSPSPPFSPDDFYRRVAERPDVRQILKRLAE